MASRPCRELQSSFMTQRWTFHPDDPRAPSSEEWQAMSVEERARVVASLPSEWEEALPPEGDRHRNPKQRAQQTLERYFSQMGRSVYVGSELPIYYPAEHVFAPDVFAVMDVALRERDRWVVDDEQRGLDWVLEIFRAGRRRKDFERNVELYSRLGIREYFLFDRGTLRLQAFRLPSASSRAYDRVLPQRGRFQSAVLGLDLGLVGDRLRFFVGDAELPDAGELIDRLEKHVTRIESRIDEEAQRANEEARRADEAERRAKDQEDRLAAALAEIERLRSKL
jgi:Uma2 family endonuclease